jgi:hypothetical protein
MHKNKILHALAVACLAGTFTTPAWSAPSCQAVAQNMNRQLGNRLDSRELADTLTSLNKNGKLPERFVTKRMARDAGWLPGHDLWSVPALKGKAIGGDRFNNFEKQLPQDRWREADLAYRGGRRNANRLIYAESGRRYLTVDHYRQFVEIPSCQ